MNYKFYRNIFCWLIPLIMRTGFNILFFLLIVSNFMLAQKVGIQNLEEVVLKTGRIDLMFKENSRSVRVITAEELENIPVNSLAELLQNVNGVDIRRRGTDGMQADLYIRGGSFEQTLVLIDGFKTENPQSGHHTMNMMIPIETIERIEIIKGPAARIYGQNAFTGAINIVTKTDVKDAVKGKIGYGSFSSNNIELTGSVKAENTSYQLHYSRRSSDGYRYNTDFKNQNIFLKSRIKTTSNDIEVLATFMERKFGANGFYASPKFKDQYEETQSSLIGISTSVSGDFLTIKPRIYWKRGQDMYEFVRGKPEIYRNMHITNKIGGAVDLSLSSDFGKTGFGADLAKVYITSNNLGDHERLMLTCFLEHRFSFIDKRFDITPGVALTYYSDFDLKAFPGIDVGFSMNEWIRIYGNLGYTYRIPTYTDLYYESPTTVGNLNLQPERALSSELGVKFFKKQWYADMVVFHRNAKDLIDYVKQNEEDRWQAGNIRELKTLGAESTINYRFKTGKFDQEFNLGYTFLQDNLKEATYEFSKYSLNSIKHQITAGFDSQFFKYLHQNILYRFVKRPDGSTYQVLDLIFITKFHSVDLSLFLNNLFDESYTETSLVPMPGRNFMFQLSYTFY